MKLGRFVTLFVISLVAALEFKLAWLYLLLVAALVALLLKLRGQG
jgi:hypothetical protein